MQVIPYFDPLAVRSAICIRLLRTLRLDGTENAIPKVGKLFERRRAVQIQIAATDSTIIQITQRKCDVIHDT